VAEKEKWQFFASIRAQVLGSAMKNKKETQGIFKSEKLAYLR